MTKIFPLKRKNPNNPQIKAYTEAIRSGKNSYHVLPGKEGWRVKRIDDPTAETFKSKDEALRHGEFKARANSGELIIHSADGKIRDRHSYASHPSTPPRH